MSFLCAQESEKARAGMEEQVALEREAVAGLHARKAALAEECAGLDASVQQKHALVADMGQQQARLEACKAEIMQRELKIQELTSRQQSLALDVERQASECQSEVEASKSTLVQKQAALQVIEMQVCSGRLLQLRTATGARADIR